MTVNSVIKNDIKNVIQVFTILTEKTKGNKMTVRIGQEFLIASSECIDEYNGLSLIILLNSNGLKIFNFIMIKLYIVIYNNITSSDYLRKY